MRYLFIVFALLPILAFNQSPEHVVTLSGQITNQNSDSIMVRSRSFAKKTIRVNADGTFRDTFSVKPGIYNLHDGSESTNLFLKNGFDLYLTLDTKAFDETIKYTGTGSEHSNFLAEKSLMEEKLLDFEALSEIETIPILEKNLTEIRAQLTEFYSSRSEVDSIILQDAQSKLDPMLNSYKKFLVSSIELKHALPKGSVSPQFISYENMDGSTTSLSDLKGKFIYIDVWATWCGPCKAEIPSLKKMEEDYRGRNIEFVSISVDDDRTHGDSWEKAREDWKSFVVKQELGGTQLFSPEGWKSEFITAYKISGIPRFILIDPAGNIVSPDAPRPSSVKLKELLDSLKI